MKALKYAVLVATLLSLSVPDGASSQPSKTSTILAQRTEQTLSQAERAMIQREIVYAIQVQGLPKPKRLNRCYGEMEAEGTR